MNGYDKFNLTIFFFTVCMLVICPGNVRADDPPSGNGERAAGHENKLADRQSIEATQKIDPETLPFFDTDIKPVLTLSQQVPGLEAVFRGVLHKRWVITKNSVAYCKDPETITVRGEKVACQDEHNVLITYNWWMGIKSDSTKMAISEDEKAAILRQNQIDIVKHELGIGVVLSTKAHTATEDLFKLFEILTRVPSASAAELRQAVDDMGFVETTLSGDCPPPDNGLAEVKDLTRHVGTALAVEYISFKSDHKTTEVKVPANGGQAPSVMANGYFATGRAAENMAAAEATGNTDPQVVYLKAVTALIQSGKLTPESLALLKSALAPQGGK